MDKKEYLEKCKNELELSDKILTENVIYINSSDYSIVSTPDPHLYEIFGWYSIFSIAVYYVKLTRTRIEYIY